MDLAQPPNAVAIAATRRRLRHDAWLLIAPLVFGASIAASHLVVPIFHLRYLLPVLPFMALAWGYGASYAWSARVSIVPAALAALVVLASAWAGRAELIVKTEDWRGAVRYVLKERPGLPAITIGVGRYFSVYLPRVVAFDTDDGLALEAWLRRPENEEFWFIMARDFRPNRAAVILQQRTEILDYALFEHAIAQRLRVRK